MYVPKALAKGSLNHQSDGDSGLFWVRGDLLSSILTVFSFFGAEPPDLPLFLLHLRTAFF